MRKSCRIRRTVCPSNDERDEIAKTEGVDACDADSSAVAGASQDLISFSLGSPRNGNDIAPAAPESMEIKSTRQVAKAVPPTASTVSDNVEPLIVPTDAISSMDSDEAAARVEAGVHLQDVDTVGFHDSEVSADVEAPSVTSDPWVWVWRPSWPVAGRDGGENGTYETHETYEQA